MPAVSRQISRVDGAERWRTSPRRRVVVRRLSCSAMRGLSLHSEKYVHDGDAKRDLLVTVEGVGTARERCNGLGCANKIAEVSPTLADSVPLRPDGSRAACLTSDL